MSLIYSIRYSKSTSVIKMDSDKVYTVADSDSEGDKEEDDANLPSREECETRCQTFAEVTGTDSALAMFYLQDRDWDLQRSISDYFLDQDKNAHGSTGAAKAESRMSSQVTSKKNSISTGSSSSATTSRSTTDPDCVTLGPSVLQPEKEGLMRVLSWNIDGLDPDNLQSRTEGACSVLLQERPEVIFLQEVVHRSLSIIKSKLESHYTVVTGDLDFVNIPGAYFTAMLLRKDSVVIEKVRMMDFPRSLMSRDLMEVQCEVKGIAMVFLTSHLESTKEYSVERCRQLKTAFDQMQASPQDRTVIFGGDLNLRDKEVTGTSAKPLGVYDMWECTGKRQEAKFTWDLKINDNKQMRTKFQPRCRFDRLYVRHCRTESHPKLKPVYFELIGIQRLASCRRFPSDHWGILAHLQVIDKSAT
ncbi:hypothetical protein RRG08_044144 [Elysia crispata]|uniref:Tyrosyl-DNA phosphodiesterase 2 n=1 Tax=Elysia crispata TaxID=231223 RepID=A0AAE1DCC1_9GAST|nr:hypothetical protein RRG08_044144 [Elysia crispata]